LAAQSGGATLNGAWKLGGGTIITIADSDGFFTQVSGNWQRVRDNGEITIGEVSVGNKIGLR